MVDEGYIVVSPELKIPVSEIYFKTVRSGGPGGQHVNKVETAIQLYFDIASSSIPCEIREKMLHTSDKRITKEGILILKSNEYRSQIKNKEEAIIRLIEFIRPFTKKRKKRIKTKPTRTAFLQRKVAKESRSKLKQDRKKPMID